MQFTPHAINLAKNPQANFLDKFINWALTGGRLIVIVTEIVAVIAFIYRFSLDETLVDLHSQIKQKQTFISLLKNDEEKYRNLQDRLTLASNFGESGTKTYRVFQDIIGFTPKDIKFTSFSINKSKLNIEMTVNSTSALQVFTIPLRNYPKIKSISVDNISKKPTTGLSVSITAILNE